MLDYQVYGLNACGYHVTNLILHILSTLLLFWLFHRISMNMFWDSLSLFVNLARHSDVAHISDESEKLLSLG